MHELLSFREHTVRQTRVNLVNIRFMARNLVLSLDGEEFEVELRRIDREELYGTVEIEAFDEKGAPAEVKVLAADGKTVIDKGGTALSLLDEDGNSITRTRLKPVDLDGNPIEPVPSSFDSVNALRSATVDDYLGLIVRSVYLLSKPEEDDRDTFDSLSNGKMYTFPFSYRGGVEHDTAMIVSNREGVFMSIGKPGNYEYLKLNQATNLDAIEEEEISAEDISFDLL